MVHEDLKVDPKTNFANSLVSYLIDKENGALHDALTTLIDCGAKVSIANGVVINGIFNSAAIIMPSATRGKFMQAPLSFITVEISSITNPENIYRFRVEEIRMISESSNSEACCIVNLNNAVFVHLPHATYEPLLLLHQAYSAEEKVRKLGDEGWLIEFKKALKENGGMEIIQKLESVEQQMNTAVKNQKYEEAAKLRDAKHHYMEELLNVIDEIFDLGE